MLAGVLIAAAAVVPRVASAQTGPTLAPISPAALVAKALSSRVQHLSGQIGLTTDLGLPDLPSLGGGQASGSQAATALSYLSGTHTADVWYGGPGQVRVAVPDGSQETDFIRNGSTAWIWQSLPYKVTKIVLPARAGTGDGARGFSGSAPAGPGPGPAVPVTPDQLAKRLLSHLGPSTNVFVTDTAWVADQPVYELGLAPSQAGQSLVADVLIAIDADNGLPLRVEVLARNATAPAVTLGFNRVRFTAPAAANFDFAPPQGAKITTDHPGAPGGSAHAGPAPGNGSSPGSGISVIGQGWDAMALIPAPRPGRSSKGRSPSSTRPSSASKGLRSSSSRSAGSTGKELARLLASGTPVNVGWGQARLVSTALVDVLALPDGRLLVGAVTPPVLEAAAARLG